MKKIIALTLLLLAFAASLCHAEVQKSYDDKNSYAMIKCLKLAPATELDPESIICVNLQKIYVFDYKGYDKATGRYVPDMYFTVAILGNAAEKFESELNYTTPSGTYTLPMETKHKQNNKKQTIQATGTCKFLSHYASTPFVEALKKGQPIKLRVQMKAKKNNVLKYTLEGDVLKDMTEIALYDIYSDTNFLNIAQKANHSPK